MSAAKVHVPHPPWKGRVCGPQVLWNWLTLDIAVVMVLLGGCTVLRSKGASPFVWLAFGSVARHLDRFALDAAERTRRRLVPAQGSPALRAAHPPSRTQGRESVAPQRRGR